MTPSTPTSYTPNLNIGKFVDGDTPGQTELNSMRDKIDLLMFQIGTLAARPVHAVTTPPRWYYTTDEGEGKLYRDDPTNGWTVMLENVDVSAITAGMTYKGTWDASSGSFPTTTTLGYFYKVSVAGTVSGTLYSVNDHIIYNGTGWDHIINAEILSPADALTQAQVDSIQYQDAGTHPAGEIPEFDALGKLKTSGKTAADIDGKMDLIAAPVDHRILSMDATGAPEDSGISISDISTLQSDLDTAETDIDTLESQVVTLQTDVDALEASFTGISGKMDKLAVPADGEILLSDENGNAEGSAVTIAALVNDTSTEVPTGAAVKAYAPERASYPGENNIKLFDANGNDLDSNVALEAAVTESTDKVPTSQAVHDFAPARAAYPIDGNLIQFDENGDLEDSGVKVGAAVSETSDEIPTSQAVHDFAPARSPYPTDGNLIQFDENGDCEDSGKSFETAITDSDSKAPTSGAVVDYAAKKDFTGYDEKTTLHNDDLVLINDSEAANVVKKVKKSNLSGTAAKPDYLVDIPSGAWDYPASNPAPLDTDTGTNGTVKTQLFDKTTEEFVLSAFRVPSDLDANGTVTFEAYGYSANTTADRVIQLKAYHIGLASAESWDTAYNSKVSGDKAVAATADVLDNPTWTETVSNLAWAANDFVRFKLSRIAPASGTNLDEDWRLVHFRIRIPRA